MNIDNKKTLLDDEAALYKHETDSLTEKEKLKNMTGAQKWQHFKQYYLLKLVLVLAAAGILTAVLVAIFRPQKKEVFYACVFDGCVNRNLVYSLQEDFEKSLALDTENYKTTFDQDFLYNGPYCDSVQRFAVLSRAGTVTVALLPESIFKMFARSSYFLNLEDFLTEEELEMFKEELVFVAEADEDGQDIEGTLAPYGLRIDACSPLAENTASEPVILAVSIGKKDNEYAKEFIKFLFANE